MKRLSRKIITTAVASLLCTALLGSTVMAASAQDILASAKQQAQEFPQVLLQQEIPYKAPSIKLPDGFAKFINLSVINTIANPPKPTMQMAAQLSEQRNNEAAQAASQLAASKERAAALEEQRKQDPEYIKYQQALAASKSCSGSVITTGTSEGNSGDGDVEEEDEEEEEEEESE